MGGYDLLDGSPDSAAAEPRVRRALRGISVARGIRDDISIFGLTIKANVGFADLTSATSYFGRPACQVQDASDIDLLLQSDQPERQPPYTAGTPFVPVPYAERDPSHQISQELRLTSHDIGGFTGWRAPSTATCTRCGTRSAPVRSLRLRRCPTDRSSRPGTPTASGRPRSLPTASYKFTDQWKLSAGVRYYHYKSHQDEYSWGSTAPTRTRRRTRRSPRLRTAAPTRASIFRTCPTRI